jgi:hypothetical protein
VPYKWGQLTASILKTLVKNAEFKTYRGMMHSSSEEVSNKINIAVVLSCVCYFPPEVLLRLLTPKVLLVSEKNIQVITNLIYYLTNNDFKFTTSLIKFPVDT